MCDLNRAQREKFDALRRRLRYGVPVELPREHVQHAARSGGLPPHPHPVHTSTTLERPIAGAVDAIRTDSDRPGRGSASHDARADPRIEETSAEHRHLENHELLIQDRTPPYRSARGADTPLHGTLRNP